MVADAVNSDNRAVVVSANSIEVSIKVAFVLLRDGMASAIGADYDMIYR